MLHQISYYDGNASLLNLISEYPLVSGSIAYLLVLRNLPTVHEKRDAALGGSSRKFKQ
jgi:hypothetical protein